MLVPAFDRVERRDLVVALFPLEEDLGLDALASAAASSFSIFSRVLTVARNSFDGPSFTLALGGFERLSSAFLTSAFFSSSAYCLVTASTASRKASSAL